jgi:nucleotidyltransferase/DNA polymerase involved in DNA repair
MSNKDDLIAKLHDIAEEVVARLKKKGKKGRKVTLFLKTAEFEMRSKTTTAKKYVDSMEDIFPLAKYDLSRSETFIASIADRHCAFPLGSC